MEIDRNTIEGFARRVRKNLDFMIVARENDEDIHIVTQLTCSLLGLIVFPYGHFRRVGFLDFKTLSLDDLVEDGWPAWAFHVGESESLDKHLSHLRNALSHRRVCFSSDNRSLAGVEVTFWDRPNEKAPDNWSASIDGAGLLEFVERLSTLIDSRA
ncbi:MAG: hypothetical protein GEU87_04170 [Alphaproteobacteria bacterium]|nr:hypothetical protein [Alphaproteobacteria bacterium]